MQYIEGFFRNQLKMESLEDKISTNNLESLSMPLSLIDFKKVGFEPKEHKNSI